MSEPTSVPDHPEQSRLVDQAEHHADVPRERVGLGLAAAVVALLLGAGITVGVWSFGFIASFTSFLMAAGATYFYRGAAGAPPRRGVVPLVALVVVAVVATFFLLVAYDAAQAYDQLVLGIPADQIDIGKSEFVRSSVFDGEVLSAYAKDMAFFFGFAALGIWSTLKNVMGSSRD